VVTIVLRRTCGLKGAWPAAIVVSQAQPPGPTLTPQEAIFLDHVGDRLPLQALEPAGQHAQHHLQRRGVDHGIEPVSSAGLTAVGRVVEQHGPSLREVDAGAADRLFSRDRAVTSAQPVVRPLWKALPDTRATDALKLAVFLGILAAVGYVSRLGLRPRTRPIVPGEPAVADYRLRRATSTARTPAGQEIDARPRDRDRIVAAS